MYDGGGYLKQILLILVQDNGFKHCISVTKITSKIVLKN